MKPDPDQVVAEIRELFRLHGGEHYGEDVTQLEHAVQVGLLALVADEPDAIVVAGFLHDIGHICAQEAETMGSFGRFCHDSNGGAWARSRGFPETVARLIENHVAAKRYLTATNPDYLARLSEASKATLVHQGGPMPPEEITEFEADDLLPLHIRLRHWDEAGKDDQADLSDIEPFIDRIRKVFAGT